MKTVQLMISIKEKGSDEDGLPLYYAYKNNKKVGSQSGYGFDIQADMLAQILTKEFKCEIQKLDVNDYYAIQLKPDSEEKIIDGCRGWSSVLAVLHGLGLDWKEVDLPNGRYINIFNKEN